MVEALTLKVHVITLEQVARTWWNDTPSGKREATARLSRLARAGWLVEEVAPVRAELRLEAPFLTWQPGDADPAFGEVAYSISRRWQDKPTRTSIYRATKRAASVFGGYAGATNSAKVDHDVHLAAVYSLFVRTRPDDAAAWLSEDAFIEERKDQVLPDAFLRDETGRPRSVIESLGHYPAKRLYRLHADCRGRYLPYEWW